MQMVAFSEAIWKEFGILPIHRIHPLPKLVTILYLLCVSRWRDRQHDPV